MKHSFRKIMAHIVASAMVLGLAAGTFPVSVSAAIPCAEISGNNVESQNYSRWTSPSTSALALLSDGRLMSVTRSDDGKVVIMYFNSSYELIDTRCITPDLPVYGGFFASSDGYYYLATGQNNPDESDSVETYRITKYDGNWNEIAHASLFGANTESPYYAGSCDFTEDGKYLLMRTCHRMYKSDDGRNHQANVTIQIDKTDMSILCSHYTVANVSVGYVSHSFNQFIRNDNGYAVAVDHGDAYPRAVVIGKYDTPISDGILSGWRKRFTYVSAIEIPGNIGANSTGISVGGFEISSTSYLIAVNTVDMSGTYDAYGTRNAAIVSVPKTSDGFGTPVMHTLTSYAQGERSASTPRLVKINDNSFLMLWTREGSVFYTHLDGNGNPGTTYSLEGALSDCNPVIYNGNVVWYVYNEGEIEFYRISTSDFTDEDEIPEEENTDADPSSFHCQWYRENGKSYWYENGVRQGTYDDPNGVIGDGTVRGREIYDSASDGWYWLDACYDGAKATGKEVWMPYIYQDEKNWNEETMRSIAYESDPGMGECVLNAMLNNSGKWVRYDEKGRMLKGWVTIEGTLATIYPDQAGNTYYYDTRTGLMAKGTVTIDGTTYHFDEITGALR